MMRLPRRILPVWIPLPKSAEVGQRYPTASSPSPRVVFMCCPAPSLGQLRIRAEGQEVQLVLDGLSIASQDGPALWVEQAEKVVVLLSDGTVNSLTDSLTYTLEDGKDEPNACLYSKGASPSMERGTLDVTGNYHHGIFCKDILSITGGAFHITAANDGVKGKAGVKILAADMTIQAGETASSPTKIRIPAKAMYSSGMGPSKLLPPRTEFRLRAHCKFPVEAFM